MKILYEIHEILKELKATTSSNQKIEILKKNQDNEIFKKLLIMAHNPEYVFGIKKIDGIQNLPNSATGVADTYTILDDITTTLVFKKIRGHQARDFLLDIMKKIEAEYRYIIFDLVNKDLKINAGVRLINKAIPGLLMDKHYMGAIPFNEEKALQLAIQNKYFYSQEKMDGMYANFDLTNGFFISRNLKPIHLNLPDLNEKTSHVQKTFSDLNGDIVLNGELLIYGLDRYTSNGILNSVSKIEEKTNNGVKIETLKEYQKIEKEYGYEEIKRHIYMVVWDYIPKKDYINGVWKVPYEDRFTALHNALKNEEEDHQPFLQQVATKKLSSLKEAKQHFKDIVTGGGEGTIIKSKDGIWETGKPNYQIKLKFEMEVELEVCGFKQGKPGSELENTLGAFEVMSSDGLIVTRAPGIAAEIRDEVWQNQSEFLGKIITVRCNGVSRDRTGKVSLLHPRFIEFRYDKDEADDLPYILKIEEGLLSV